MSLSASTLFSATCLLGAWAALTPPRVHPIQIRNFTFAPAADTIAVGQSVAFRNHDLVPHTATADRGTFESGTIAADRSWRFVARHRGVVTYHCRFHPTMHGTLVIR